MLPVKLSFMAATPTTVTPNRCLRQRNSDSECRYCLDACPAGAVKLDQRELSVDENRCFGCGLCLVTCPVECFETGDWSERSIVSALDHIGRQSVEMSCGSHPAPAVGNDANPVVQVKTCLGAISPGLWFEIGLKYSVKLRLEYCTDCPMKGGAGYARQAVELANAWRKSCERGIPSSGSVFIQDMVDNPRDSLRRVVISAERPILNRRDFLFGFARSSGPADLALTKLPYESRGEEWNLKVPPHVPAWLRRMADIYPDNGIEKADDGCSEAPEGKCIHWPTLKISKKKCTVCGACALNCPSGALVTKVIDGQYRHLFTPGLCVACGLCAQVCPTEALSRTYKYDKSPFEERVVDNKRVVTCIKCGRPALPKADGLCYCCSNEPKINTVMDSASRQLFRKLL